MPITHEPGTTLAFQQQFRPIGRIRTGQQVEFTKGGRKGKRPARLETFRLTSADERMLQRAAEAYGGTVEEWPEAPDGDALQLVTEARELDVLVPGGQPLSQWYEMWGAGGCLRRCTGLEETLSGNGCLCDVDPGVRTEMAGKGEACKPTTRVNLLLPDMDVGAWLLVTHSYYAAVELPPVVSLLSDLASRSQRPVPAKLWIDARRIKRPNQPPKEFSVVALRTEVTWAGLLSAEEAPAQPALAPGNGHVAASLPSGETELPDDPAEEQSFGVAGVQPAAKVPPAQDAPGPDAEAPQLPESAPEAEPAAQADAVPDGLTQTELAAALTAINVTPAGALAKAKEMWPAWVPADGQLSPAQRAELLAALMAERQAAVL